MQRVPSVTRADVERVIRRDFSSEEGAAASSILNDYPDDPLERASGHHRVHLAALKLAHGDLQELRQQIRDANLDYRDVLAAAEYPEAFRRWPGMDAMSEEARQEIHDADWAQYHAWLSRS